LNEILPEDARDGIKFDAEKVKDIFQENGKKLIVKFIAENCVGKREVIEKKIDIIGGEVGPFPERTEENIDVYLDDSSDEILAEGRMKYFY